MKMTCAIIFVGLFLAASAPAALEQGKIFMPQQQALYKNVAIMLALQATQQVLIHELAPSQEGRKKLLSRARAQLHQTLDDMLETQLSEAERLDHRAAIREVDGYFRKFTDEYFNQLNPGAKRE